VQLSNPWIAASGLVERIFVLVPAQVIVGQFMANVPGNSAAPEAAHLLGRSGHVLGRPGDEKG